MIIKHKSETINLEEIVNTNMFTKISENEYTFYEDGILKNCFIHKNNDKIYVAIQGEHYEFTEVDEYHKFEQIAKNNLKSENISSPMPGNIVKILVEVGEDVKENTPLIIVEAMKMETTLSSSIAGTVTKINVSTKEQIQNDVVLIEIERN
jgi:biotin carboxyl carrier protein